MKRAAEKQEEPQMTDKQFARIELMTRKDENQRMLDLITDPDSRTILEDRKKELTEKLDKQE